MVWKLFDVAVQDGAMFCATWSIKGGIFDVATALQ
jgi:hypothetical protein